MVEGEVRLSRHDRMLYATDASLYQVEPLAVIIPRDVDDAVAAVRACARLGLPILPRGGGTSLAGQCTNEAVVIDLSVNCRGLEWVSAETRGAYVEPGITVDDLNDEIASTGLFFAPDPATSRHANIGGCIGNNAAGARSIRYFRTSENVEAVRACLASGEVVEFSEGAAMRDRHVMEITRRVAEVVARHAVLIRERFPRTLRRSAGYQLDVILKQMEGAGWRDGEPVDERVLGAINLAPLLCGSEGTLAVTLGATLRLHPRPAAKALATLGFSDLDEAIATVVPILATGPTAIELLDDTIVDLALANAEYRAYAEMMPRPSDGRPLKAVLYVEYFGASEAEVRERADALRRAVPGVALDLHMDSAAQMKAWKLRKAGEPLLHGIPGTRKPITFVEDNAVPVEHLSAFVKEFRAMVAEHGTIAAYYAHASVGVLHIRPLIDIHTEADRATMRSIAEKAAALARKHGGVMSGEHGDGRVRTPFLADYYGPELMEAFKEIKRIFDPQNLLNPGNIVDLGGDRPRPVESITESLRVKPAGREVGVDHGTATYFSYDDQHGLDAAVEMCNGSGVCRKKQGGTMCPSYMATLDERHSTRGRGNALRLAITGQLREGGGALTPDWNDAETIRTLDLCLSCKACKTECPSNVDISRLKAEYTAKRFETSGTPLAARIMGEIRTLSRLGSVMPAFSNWASTQAWARAIAGRVLGIDPRRSLPRFSRSLARQWGSGAQVDAAAGSPRVALFGDCFTMFNEPGIGLATRRVLGACGYRVELADAGCCGRAKLSMGLLPQAIEEIDATLERLAPLALDPGIVAILVAEPSCLSAIKDDWLQLKVRTPLDVRKAIAAKAMLPEQFIGSRWEKHPRRPSFAKPRGRVVLHGHCHQKALWSVESSAAVLRRVVGDKLVVLDSGCCGMAGSFGYTRERYDLSMKIGELAVLPAARGAAAEDIIAATGTSCRHQIHDGAARESMHPIEVLSSLMVDAEEGIEARGIKASSASS
jgi:FAD/FMN-containing dehydrogenase/Fe-S oxidoreductase